VPFTAVLYTRLLDTMLTGVENSYGARQNPYDQRQAVSPGFNSPEFRQTNHYGEHHAMGGRDDYGMLGDISHSIAKIHHLHSQGQNVELTPLANAGSQFGATENTMDFLDGVVKPFGQAIDNIESKHSNLKSLQQASLNSADPSGSSANAQATSRTILDAYRNLVQQIRKLKSDPANQPETSKRGIQVARLNTKLKLAMEAYQVIDRDFENKLREQQARQMRIVRPDATEQEVRDAVENGQGPVFAQALMQSDRRGQSQSTMNAVRSRHEDIQKIESQMVELALLFEEMNNLIVQQEAAVENIEMKGEEVVENMDKGTEQIGVAIKSARNARKWKWWCLGICGMCIPLKQAFAPLTDSPNSLNCRRYCHCPFNYQAMANSGTQG
jgi:syntaxin 1B/2/3